MRIHKDRARPCRGCGILIDDRGKYCQTCREALGGETIPKYDYVEEMLRDSRINLNDRLILAERFRQLSGDGE